MKIVPEITCSFPLKTLIIIQTSFYIFVYNHPAYLLQV